LGKILLLVLAIWLLLTILKGYRRNVDSGQPAAKVDDMVQCEQCGVHVPADEGVQKNGKHYCSDICRNSHHPSGQ